MLARWLPALVVDELFEGLAFAGDGWRRAGPLRVEVAEADDAVDGDVGGDAENLAEGFFGEVGWAGSDAVVPGGEHHVLGAAAGIEGVWVDLGDDDDGGGFGEPAGHGAEVGEVLFAFG